MNALMSSRNHRRTPLPFVDEPVAGVSPWPNVTRKPVLNRSEHRCPSLGLRAALWIVAGCVVGVAPVAAAPYEAFIDVSSEDDLEDLLATEQITAETHAALLTLLERGVDLNTATREELYSLPNLTYADADAILEYRKAQGRIDDPASLVGAGALSDDKLVAIAAFLVVRKPDRSALHGLVRATTRATQGDDTIPPMAVLARLRSGRYWTGAMTATLDRRAIGPVTWDPNRGGFMADEPGLGASLPKYYVRYRSDRVDAIAGTYRVGFGQRVTFDSALDYTPNGIYSDDLVSRSYDLTRDCVESTGELASSPCGGDLRYQYVTPDFDTSDGLRGVAAGTERLGLGGGYLQAYGWASYQTRGVYQYEIADGGACEDPRADTDACAAPDVFVRNDDALAPTAELSYQTLPDVVAESLLGANLTYWASPREFVGVTGYGAMMHWLPETPAGVELDFQEWSRFPTGGRYGAVGANAGIGLGKFDVFAEVSHSFDSLSASGGPVDGGGGPAALLRATHTEKKRELELSLRYYDPDFVNPYAGSIAAADEVEGQRARGEHGARLRYTATHGGLSVRTGLDLWRSLAEVQTASGRDWDYVSRGDVYVRADAVATRDWGWGLWLRYQDKGLQDSRELDCFEVFYEDGALDEPATCFGSKLTSTGRVRYTGRALSVTAQAQHELLDDDSAHLMGDMRQDLSGLLVGTWRAAPRTRVLGRVRYLNEDISDNAYLEHSVRTAVEVAQQLRTRDRLVLRVDMKAYLDDRASTELRSPSPELWLGADYQSRF